MPIRAVFLDAGNTLVYPEPPVGEVYARALRRAGVDASGPEVQRTFEEALRRLRGPAGTVDYGLTEEETLDWWRRVVRESIRPFGVPEAFEGVFRSLWSYFGRPEAWRVYDDVFPLLDALDATGVPAGLISNWDVRLDPILDGIGLRQRLRWVAISGRLGVEKPAPEIFHRALQCCGLPAAAVMHVGDSWPDDVQGALGVGMRAAWLRRDGDGQAPVQGVPVLRSLSEVLPLLA